VKVSVGYEVIEGPWGGGNRFVSALCEALARCGHVVVHDLNDDDIDLIVMIDPRTRVANIPFGAGGILRYLAFTKRNAVVLHRINECDERKNTRFVNFRLRLANYAADHTVFVGSWLKDLDVWRKRDGRGSSVIFNGADPRIFNANGHQAWKGTGPVRLVTHHWGGNWMKGFDVYQKIDRMLADARWKGRLEFTYIGNIPDGFRFEDVKHVAPMDGESLVAELRSHHIYITASINEPGGNHQNEGAFCGLPLLYRNSGSMPEYCNGFGVMFEGPDDFEDALQTMINEYGTWQDRIVRYPHTIGRTVDAYTEQMERLYANREELVKVRNIWRNPLVFFLNQFSF